MKWRRRASDGLTGDVRLSPLIDSFRHDVRYSLRVLRRQPAFAITVLVTLAMGIGATTAIYSIADRVLLQPLPFANADRLVHVFENTGWMAEGRPVKGGVTFDQYREWRNRATTLEDVIALMPGRLIVRTQEGTARLWGGMISGNAFSVLGTRATLGRTLQPGDERSGGVVVLSFETWQRLFASDPEIIGKTIESLASEVSPRRLLTVVGVLPAEFEFPLGQSDYYTPFALAGVSRNWASVRLIGRLRAGVPLQAAIHEANTIGSAILKPRAVDAPRLVGQRVGVQPLKDEVVDDLRPALRVLLAAVVVVLLIVCANVANLLLARGTARSRELVVRIAIGASRGRVIRQLFIESLVLAAIGGACGALVGALGVTLVKKLATLQAPGLFRIVFGTSILPRANELGVDPKIFGIAFSVAAVSAVVYGLTPALHLSRTTVQSMVPRVGGSDPSGSRMRAALVIIQVALGMVLLTSAALLTRSFVKLLGVEKGYQTSNVLAFQLVFPSDYSIARKADTIAGVVARVRSSPNIEAAGFARAGVLIGEQIVVGTFVPRGRNAAEIRAHGIPPRVRPVSGGYLTAIGARTLEGRDLSDVDEKSVPIAIVINRTVARRFFGNRGGVGQIVDWQFDNHSIVQARVVGIIGDLRNTSPDHDSYPEVFVHYRPFLALQERLGASPLMQEERALGVLSFAARTRVEPMLVAPEVSRLVRAVDPAIGIDAMLPLDRLLGAAVARPRFYAGVLLVFASVATCLAAIGIYGVLAYGVAQRTHEIAVRMALGARRSQILGLVLRHAASLAAVGIVLGLAAAMSAAGILRGLLFDIAPLDPATFFTVSLLFAVIAGVASVMPARRATRVEPMSALRAE